MTEKNITQADIARTGFVKSAAVSMLFSFHVKSVGVDMCRAISAATGIPLAIVYEKAGLLPPSAGELSPKKRQLVQVAENLSEDDADVALAVIQSIVDRKKQK